MVLYENIINIVNKIKLWLKSDIPEVKEVSTGLKLNEREYIFPRIDILPEREVIDEIRIGNIIHSCKVSIRILPAIKEYDHKKGSEELLKLTGKVYDSIYNHRLEVVPHECVDLYIDTIENHYFTGDNYVLYVSSIMTMLELHF